MAFDDVFEVVGTADGIDRGAPKAVHDTAESLQARGIAYPASRAGRDPRAPRICARQVGGRRSRNTRSAASSSARGTTASMHNWGMAWDWRWADPGPGRQAADAVIEFAIDESARLGIQAVHDYVNARYWKCDAGWRTAHSSPETGFGQPWSQWLHIERTWDAANDPDAIDRQAPALVQPPAAASPAQFQGELPTGPLHRGDKGADVARIQDFLRSSGFADFTVSDGEFGPRTDASVRDAQTAFAAKGLYTLAIDGRLGAGNSTGRLPIRWRLTMSINRPDVPSTEPEDTSSTATESSSNGSDGADNEPVVEISIIHSSLACADYPLMIGGFADHPLGGPERFIDRQFAGLLTQWAEVELFPTAVGTSRFIDPNPNAETEPPGCYVIGLGSVVDLQREQLTFGVRQALLDRCDRLRREHLADASENVLIEVGVSSSLMGVSSDRGLRVEDSVAGIVEGVLQANEALARPSRAGDGRPAVRVTALQFVERFAEQANLAAVALRSLSSAVHLASSYDTALRSITVTEQPGGLPLGATLTEVGQTWRRFVITAVDSNDLGTGGDAHAAIQDADDRSLTFDIAMLGREARADRVRHRLDRVMVDALVDRLVLDTGDQRTAATLYDQLIPLDLRSEFQTTSAIQFVVDTTTANYPWELLAAPRPSGGRSAGGAFGGVIRQFTESDHRRLNPERALFGSALVIAAGKVPGENELPSVYDECDLVARLLDETNPGKVTLLDDRRSELDLVDLQNELFGNHQVVHIASHGVYNDGRAADTGAILARGAMLTIDTIRQLASVPDVVFLNCCSLGRIGQNRMAAGLAREFMAIGVRALVAAAWPIDDGAARVFAETFYRELIGGRPLGDAIPRAPATSAPRSVDVRHGPPTSATATLASSCAVVGCRSARPCRSRSAKPIWSPVSTVWACGYRTSADPVGVESSNAGSDSSPTGTN